MNQLTLEEIMERWRSLPSILKEAMYSPITLSELETASRNFHLSEEKSEILEDLVKLVFLGFIHFDNLYKEIRDNLNIDSRLALDIFHYLDKKIFESLRKEIEDNYIKHKIGVVKESEVISPQPVDFQVVLKQGSDVINLKDLTLQEPVKIKVEEEKEAQTLVKTQDQQIELKEEKTFQTQPSLSQEKEQSFKEDTKKDTSFQVSEGPVIIHQKEEIQSVAKTQSNIPFRQTSFGGYMGSFKSFLGSQRPQTPVSSAKIEIPFSQTSQKKEDGEQKVPLIVKKYENNQDARVVHYSNLKTPLNSLETQSSNVSPSSSKDSKNLSQEKTAKGNDEGVIDLTNLTFKN